MRNRRSFLRSNQASFADLRLRDTKAGPPDKNSGQVSRLLKRLRVHGLIKKVGHTYKYYLTRFGKAVITTGLKLRELVIIPQLAINGAA